jgi:bacterioferritin (cytochrome b1)
MKTSALGLNKTGLHGAPGDGEALLRDVEADPSPEARPPGADDALRGAYFEDVDPLGSVPPPLTLRGVVKSGTAMLLGGRMQAVMDKLGERLAFERAGVRLYEAFLRKCRFRPDEAAAITIGTVEHFMHEEAMHLEMLREAIERLGGDPTAQTPCADVVGMQTLGLAQSVLDPRTTVLQSLHAVLCAELVDGDGWTVLAALMKDAGETELAQRFEEAFAAEERHLSQVRTWYERMSLDEASLSARAEARP